MTDEETRLTASSPHTVWNPARYLRFADHRLRPALELMARIPLERPGTIVDLGCGTGHITRLLAERWPAARVTGVDHSAEMLAEAAAVPSPIRWIQADIGEWRPERPVDLVFANASLHWIEGHDALFARLMGMVSSGGCLAVQMPLSWPLPSHRLMRETLADGGPGGAPIGGSDLRRACARKWVDDAPVYFDRLHPFAATIDIWESEYLQVLDGADPVLEWVRGSGLRPVLQGLGEDDRERFLPVYTDRLRKAYPRRADGTTLYPFRRLFIVAVKR